MPKFIVQTTNSNIVHFPKLRPIKLEIWSELSEVLIKILICNMKRVKLKDLYSKQSKNRKMSKFECDLQISGNQHSELLETA